MVKIACRAIDCIFWEDNHCISDKIIYDPEEGCLTFALLDEVIDDDSWDDDEDLDTDLDADTPLDDLLEEPFDDLDDEAW